MKKVLSVFLGIFCGFIQGIVYFYMTDFLFYNTFPADKVYVSMKNIALICFVILSLINFLIFKFVKKRNKATALSFFISTTLFNIILLIFMSGVNYYFD